MDCNILLEKYNNIKYNLIEKKKEINFSNDSPLLKSYLLEEYINLKIFRTSLLNQYKKCKKNNINNNNNNNEKF
jgi:hypothetical protein